jgi:CheY-like chemotaxis protein
MHPAALLVSRDAAVLDLVLRLLEDESIGVEVSADVRRACDLLEKRKFDAVIVDCDDLLGAEVLLRLRHTPSNRRAVAFALLNGITSLETAFALGADFGLHKPLCPDATGRSLRAAHGLILRECHRYFRHPMDLSASFTLPEGKTLYVQVINLSQEGMAVELLTAIPPGTHVQVRFDLPENYTTIEACGEVAWCHDGRAGIHFQEIPPLSKLRYRRWLAENMTDNPFADTSGNATQRGA